MWLVPAALVALGAAWWLTRGWGRRDPRRAGLLLWGSWLIVVLTVLASLRGISHGYYTLELAPAVSGGLALGAAPLWRATRSGTPRWAGRVLVAGVSINACGSSCYSCNTRPGHYLSLPSCWDRPGSRCAMGVSPGEAGHQSVHPWRRPPQWAGLRAAWSWPPPRSRCSLHLRRGRWRLHRPFTMAPM